MSEENIDSNIEWDQSKKFSKNTRISRRLDQQKADLEDSLSKNNFKKTAKPIKNIAPNLKKIQSKIRDIYDDDEEDEDEKSTVVFDFDFDNSSSSLYNVLSEEEKSHLAAVKNIEDMEKQQIAGKNADILRADQMSKELGLKDLDKKIISETTQDITFSEKTYEETLIKNISKKTKLKTDHLSSKENIQMVKGLEKMKQANLVPNEKNLESISRNMTTQNLIEIGKEKNDKKAAELIVEKSGRPKNKKQSDADKKEKKEKIKKIEKSLNKIKSR